MFGVLLVLMGCLALHADAGTNFIYWGGVCSGSAGSKIIYRGWAAKTPTNKKGGGATYLCLPSNPQWHATVPGIQGKNSLIVGTEFHHDGLGSLIPNSKWDHADIPCTACVVPAASQQIMIPVEKKYAAFYTGGKVQQSTDGCHLFCQNNDKVEILELETGKLLKSIENEASEEVSCFVLSPDDKLLILASRNLVLRQWDWKEGSLTRTWKAVHTAPVSCMSFDETSTLLATGGSDSTIKVWDVIQKYCTHNLKGHTGVISIAEFDPDISKLRLFTAGEDYDIMVWDLKTSNCMHVLKSHYSVIKALVFSPDRTTFYSGGRDNIITVWDMKSLEKQKTIPVYEAVEGMVLVPSEGDFGSLGVTTGDIHVITAGAKGYMRIFNTATSQCVHNHKLKTTESKEEETDVETNNEGSLTAIMYNKTLNTVTVTTYDHNILIYNMDDLSLDKQFIGYQDEILDIKFVGARDSHIAVSTNSQLVQLFRVSDWSCQLLYGHTDTVMSLDVSTDKKVLVSASKDNTVRLWGQKPDSDVGEFDCLAVGKGHTSTVQSVAFSRGGNSFLLSGSQDLTLKLWPLSQSNLSTDSIDSLHSKVTEKAHEKDINFIAVAPNDKLVATGSQDKTAKLWRVDGLSLVGVFRGHKKGIWCVKFSPIDQCLATSSTDGSVKIWALSDFTCVKTFEGHDSSVLKVVFISRGMQLLTTGSDGLLKLWTIKTNECVKTFDEHQDKAWALECNEEEDMVVTGGEDSQIIVWRDVTEVEQEEIRAKQMDVIMKEQTLQNLLHQKKYLKAIGLAINLDQPFRVLNIMKEILIEEGGTEDLENTVLKLKDFQIDAILRYAGTWNTNSKHCHTAQFVLSVIFKTYSPDKLFKLANFKSSLEGLIPYTDRHCQRLKKLQQQSTFVEYTWQSMRLVSADSNLESVMDVDTFNHPLGSTSSKPSKKTSSSSDDDEDSSSSFEKLTHIKEKPVRSLKDGGKRKSPEDMEVDSSISTSDSSGGDYGDDDNDNQGKEVESKTSKKNKFKSVDGNNKQSMFLSDELGKKSKNNNVEDSAFDEGDSDSNDRLIMEETTEIKSRKPDGKRTKKGKQQKNVSGKNTGVEIGRESRAALSSKKRERLSSASAHSDTSDSGSEESEEEVEVRKPYTQFKLTGVRSERKEGTCKARVNKKKKSVDPKTKKSNLKSKNLKRGKLTLK